MKMHNIIAWTDIDHHENRGLIRTSYELARETAKPISVMAKHFRLAGLFQRVPLSAQCYTISFARRGYPLYAVGSVVDTHCRANKIPWLYTLDRRCRVYPVLGVCTYVYASTHRSRLKAFELLRVSCIQ